MKMRICSKCGREIEDERPRGSRYCLECASNRLNGQGAVAWCIRWARERQRQSAMRRADLDETVEPASVVYAKDDPYLGHVVIEWRGTTPPCLKHIHACHVLGA